LRDELPRLEQRRNHVEDRFHRGRIGHHDDNHLGIVDGPHEILLEEIE
jgi:hypothetical protein